MPFNEAMPLWVLFCVCIVTFLLNIVTAGTQDRFVADGETDVYQEVLRLKQEVETLKSLTGSSYTRWGRTTCPGNDTTKIYSGFMAGTSYSGSGSAADYLCLPSDPSWDFYEDDAQNNILITGVQYEFNPHLGADAVKFFGADLRGAEAPCSVCRTTRSTTIMIPGRTDCYGSWTKEYSGYLVGGFAGYSDSSEYICLDRRPETVPHSGHWDNENLLYFVEGNCGKNLACPPYVDGRELACVVCSI